MPRPTEAPEAKSLPPPRVHTTQAAHRSLLADNPDWSARRPRPALSLGLSLSEFWKVSVHFVWVTRHCRPDRPNVGRRQPVACCILVRHAPPAAFHWQEGCCGPSSERAAGLRVRRSVRPSASTNLALHQSCYRGIAARASPARFHHLRWHAMRSADYLALGRLPMPAAWPGVLAGRTLSDADNDAASPRGRQYPAA
ncbi:hypothetical protein D9M68_07910 [compost metagenome]